MARTLRDSSSMLPSGYVTPVCNGLDHSFTGTPSQNGLSHLRQRLERQLMRNSHGGDVKAEDKISPTLAKLRMTPGHVFKEKQQVLIQKHQEAREKADQLNVGGGVTLWPEMNDMRLSHREAVQLIIACACLVFIVIIAFHKIHGTVVHKLLDMHVQLSTFQVSHVISVFSSQDEFNSSILQWHVDFKNLLNVLDKSFGTSRLPYSYLLYIAVYVVGLATLVYYLLDNMLARSKLSPRRIKRWMCLLVVIGCWTLLMGYLLVCAHLVELGIEQNVHKLNEVLADAVQTELNLSKFSMILSYWTTKCLPPTAQGTLSVLGIMTVRDVMHYLQYYAVPVLMILLTPVVKLIVSLQTVYNQPKSR